jgi:hypothetical protein
MIRRLRRSSRLLAPLAAFLVALVLVGTVDWWHVADAEDAALPSIHDHDQHRAVFRGQVAPESPTGEHCYLCHWQRSLQNGFDAGTRHAAADTESRQLQPASVSRTTDSVCSLLPARAPPV